MIRRYLVLFAVVAVMSFVLAVLGRPRPHAPPTAPAARPAPVVELAITIEGGRLTPEVSSVPKDVQVRLTIEHRGPAEARLALAGYEDRLAIPRLAPGAVWQGAFLADRPGEDFAWLLDGRPVGRFGVTGSHLVDGHR